MTRIVRIALITIAGFALLIGVFLLILIAGGTSEAAPGEFPAVAITVSTTAPVETTAPARVEHELTVRSPQVGYVVTNPLVVTGTSTADQLGYRLLGGGSPLAEGTIVVEGWGMFSTTVEFTNTCCIEMTLEVFDIEPDAGLGVSIPLAYSEIS